MGTFPDTYDDCDLPHNGFAPVQTARPTTIQTLKKDLAQNANQPASPRSPRGKHKPPAAHSKLGTHELMASSQNRHGSAASNTGTQANSRDLLSTSALEAGAAVALAKPQGGLVRVSDATGLPS